MAFQTPPQRHWRSYGTDPLPMAAEAMNEPFRAFPSWFLRIECDRCGKVSILNEAHTTGRRREMPLRALLARMRLDGCVRHRQHRLRGDEQGCGAALVR